MRKRFILAVLVVAMLSMGVMVQGQVNVKNYIPFATWDDACDLRPYIQDAFDSASSVIFGGVQSPAAPPVIYPMTTILTVPDNHTVQIYADAKILRLPSEGVLFYLGDGVTFKGHEWGGLHSTIDGNRNAHWAAGFTDLGKHDEGIHMSNNCIVTYINIENNPGIAFAGISNNSVRDCIARNCGYIGLKYNKTYYAASWDASSADGFYFWGNSNYARNCESYDVDRWDFCASHTGSQFNTFESCYGEDIDFRTYGYCDFEAVSLGYNVMINCTSRTWAGSSHNNISISQPDCTLTNMDLGQSHLRYDHEVDNNLVNGATMGFMQLARYYTSNNIGTIELKGAIDIATKIHFENAGQSLWQSGGTMTVGTDITDTPGYYPDSTYLKGYFIKQDAGAVMTVNGSVLMGDRELIYAQHVLEGGQLHMASTAAAGDALVYGVTGHAQVLLKGGTITADPCDPVPVVIGWTSEALADMRGYGTVATGGHFVNNGRVIAMGYGTERDLDLTGVSDINNFYSANGSGDDGAPQEVSSSENGWFAFWRGRLVLPPVPVGAGFATVNWGAGPAVPTPSLVNSVQVAFSGSTGGDLEIALLAANRNDVNLDQKVTGVWDMSFDGTFGAVALTLHYDPNEAAELGFVEGDLNVYQLQADGTWDDVTATVATATKLISTVPLTTLGRFIVAPDPSVCGDPGSGLSADLTGDCRVNLADMAVLCDDPSVLELWVIGQQWLQCTDPAGCD